MLIDIYSGAHCWVLVPQGMKLPTFTGPLTYEGTVPRDFLEADHVWAKPEMKSYAMVCEDIGLQLLDKSLSHFGFLDYRDGDATA